MTHTEKHESGQSLEADLDDVRREAIRGHVSDAPDFVPASAPNIAERIEAEIAGHGATSTPFPELEDAGDIYDLCVFLTVILSRDPGDGVADAPGKIREYCIESGRNRGAWHLRVSPWNGSLTDDDVLTGPPVVDRRDQTEGPDPLALLRALLTGESA
jgi:hypothetical protein